MNTCSTFVPPLTGFFIFRIRKKEIDDIVMGLLVSELQSEQSKNTSSDNDNDDEDDDDISPSEPRKKVRPSAGNDRQPEQNRSCHQSTGPGALLGTGTLFLGLPPLLSLV